MNNKNQYRKRQITYIHFSNASLQIFSDRFYLALYTDEVTLLTFSMMKCRKSFILFNCLKIKYFHFYDKVGSFDEGFQQVPLVQNFSNLHTIVMVHQLFQISKEK